MQAFIKKLISYLPRNLASICGIAQVIVKFVKEVCTLLVNLICPIIPGSKDDDIVKAVRAVCNMVDGWIEKLKEVLLKI